MTGYYFDFFIFVFSVFYFWQGLFWETESFIREEIC
jgi:hypothetical protein